VARRRYVIELTEAEHEAVLSAVYYARISPEYEGACASQQLAALRRAEDKIANAEPVPRRRAR
jgi:hypothetical protein